MALSVLRPLALASLMLTGLAACFAAAAQGTSHACAAIADANERLACYDGAFPPIAGAGTIASAEQLKARRELAEREFGLNRRQIIDRRPAALREIEPDRVQSTVKSILERGDGQRMVTLESGQVWLLTEVTSRGRLDAGDVVTMREAALGTYMLVTPRGRALRAKRLR